MKLISETTCPRCGAKAQTKPEEATDEILMVYLRCPKCRYRKLLGFTTYSTITDQLLLKKLENLLNSSNNELVKASLRSKIENLRTLIKKKELGL